MKNIKRSIPVAALSMFAFAACNSTIDSAVQEGMGADVGEQSIEQELGLIPQLLRARDVPVQGMTLRGEMARYVIMSAENGAIDIDTIGISRVDGSEQSLSDLFDISEETRNELTSRDALLLVNVPEADVVQLCERFQFGHAGKDIVFEDGEQLLFTASTLEGRGHALCIMPKFDIDTNTAQMKGSEPSSAIAKSGDPQNYGSGSYTVAIKTLKCNNPRDWENWPYNGDEARLRGFYNGIGGSELWASNDVESGDSYSPNRYVHFNSNAKLELYDYDSALWNASDKLGEVSVYPESACLGNRYGGFDGNGGGHSWDYDMTYRVYGPNCPCQTQEPQIPKSYNSESCSATSSTVTSSQWYCSGGTYWRQDRGNVNYYCTTNCKTYNESCEMKTLLSTAVVSARTTTSTNVAIGNPVAVGTCTIGSCGPQPSVVADPSAQYVIDCPPEPATSPDM